MIYNALAKHLGVEPNWKPLLKGVSENKIEVIGTETTEELFTKLFSKSYDVVDDYELLKQGINLPDDKRGLHFDSLRKNYKIRRELNNFEISISSGNGKFKNLLNVLRILFK
jgi:hypothetical protein